MHAIAARFFRTALVALALAGLSSPAEADLWYEHYAAAERALDREEWAQAVDQLQQALERKGDSGARTRTYGMRFIAYFPYLRLGIAYYQLGQYDAALQAFETEERLGAIAESAEATAELERYRRLASEAKGQAREREAERIRQVVQSGLETASTLEAEGRIEEAIAALGEALAVSPEDPGATEMVARLRGKLSEAQRAEERRRRIARLLESGGSLLERERFAEAASVLRQALDLDANDAQARALLDQAQRRLREESPREAEASAIDREVEEARRLFTIGRWADALERLQPVLALDPEHPEAQALERTLLTRQAEAERERLRGEAIEGYLADGEVALAAGRYEAAMASANRVLAVDSGNPSALEQLTRAYRAVSSRLLGSGPRQNFPPAIRFADQREELPDGTMAQVVRQPELRITGVVIDDSPVEIQLFDAAEQRIAATVSTQVLGDLYLTEFQVVPRLEVGLNSLRLVATDAADATSAAEYAVLYSRPFVRSPWFFLALGFAGGGAAVALWVVRRRRLRRLHERRFNPYVAGAPVLDDRLFFGREQLLERILQTIHNNSLLLHGERRIGKTTLQHQLKRRLDALEDPAYEFHAVFVDLQGTPQELFFATLGEEIFEELAPVLDGLKPRAPFTETYGYSHLVADLRSILKVLRQRTSKRVRLVLLIDEVDELNSYDPRVNQKLRSLFMKSFAEDLVAVVSGVSIQREWEREGSPWYNFFEELDVGPFHPDHARELVEKPIRGIFRLEDGVVERIVEATGGRPYRIQKLCIGLVSRAHEGKRREIGVADVEAVLEGGTGGES